MGFWGVQWEDEGGSLRLRVRSEGVNKWRQAEEEEAQERGGRWKGGGNKGDRPSGAVGGGLSHARTCGGCSGSTDWRKCARGGEGGGGAEQKQFRNRAKASTLSPAATAEGRGEQIPAEENEPPSLHEACMTG
ncbi:hypothetical protein VZT92_004405 [Zoarces viviparus]|uniref:Uncharacterized protein n=1 Tax=Zoarces viviparus TaxID=48416 RepID=A0AAW1FZX0_ZOAVI